MSFTGVQGDRVLVASPNASGEAVTWAAVLAELHGDPVTEWSVIMPMLSVGSWPIEALIRNTVLDDLAEIAIRVVAARVPAG